MKSQRPFLSFVVIGLNEAEHLETCLRSALEASWPEEAREVLYVDSGSTDGSREIARRLGVRVLLLEDPEPNASKGRNLGWRNARGELVQFLDGDMELHPDWPEKGWRFLEAHPEAALVFGRVVERHPENLFCRLFELDWGTEGEEDDGRGKEVEVVGGAALYRTDALAKAGGFDPTLGGGEEPELCWRLRNELGLKAWRLPSPMVTHDLAMTRLRQWWKRAERDGRSFAAVALRFWKTEDPLWRRHLVNLLLVGSSLPAATLLSILLGSLLPLLVFLLLFTLLVARKTLQWWRRTGDLRLGFLYALHVYVGKFPLALGAVKYILGRLTRPSP